MVFRLPHRNFYVLSAEGNAVFADCFDAPSENPRQETVCQMFVVLKAAGEEISHEGDHFFAIYPFPEGSQPSFGNISLFIGNIPVYNRYTSETYISIKKGPGSVPGARCILTRQRGCAVLLFIGAVGTAGRRAYFQNIYKTDKNRPQNNAIYVAKNLKRESKI